MKIVGDLRRLQMLCGQLRGAGSFALDTEFVRDRTYYIRLGILQVATDGLACIVDPYPLESLTPLLELVSDPSVEKIVHAGAQDLAVLYERSGSPPRNVFDTQVAAALVGYGDQISYGRLVEKIAGVRLSKTETLTDWTTRPLSDAQIEYALEDVRYLPPVRRKLGEELAGLGREGWLAEELQYLEDAATYTPPEPREYYQRIKARGLDAAQKGALRELAAWREEEAMRRDVPRGWILRDAVLVDIARKRPTSAGELKRFRQIKPQELERSRDEILSAVRRGAAAPVEEAADKVSSQVSSKVEALLRLLESWLYSQAHEARVAPSLLATRDELRTLAAGHIRGQLPVLPVLRGWRKELVGKDLLDILAGRLTVTVDPRAARLNLLHSDSAKDSAGRPR